MTAPHPGWWRRVFPRLVRLSVGRLMDAALGSRAIAAEQFVIWAAALLATPTLLYTVRAVSWYPFLRQISLERLQEEALRDRLFFIVWAMLVAALLVSVLWEALVPDRTDQHVLGVLPVGARPVAAARLAAALAVGVGLIAAINGPTALIYGLTSAVHPVLGSRALVAAGQLLATVAAGAFTFTLLLAVRGLLVVAVGASAAARAAVVLQAVTVLLLVEAFLFLPGLLPAVLDHLSTPGVPESTWLVPGWFLGLSVAVGGPRAGVFGVMAPTAVGATVLVVVMAVVIALVPAPWLAHRAVEARTSDRRGRFGAWSVDTASALAASRRTRALVAFILRSLARSPRHQFIIASWVGLALAVCSVQILAAQVQGVSLPLGQPFEYLVALPLVMTFCLVGGLRTAFSLPTDVLANWTFRATTTEAREPCVNAVRTVLWLVAVAPVSVSILVAGGWLWGLPAAAAVAAMHAATGLLLCELAVLDCESIPFTRERGLSAATLKVKAPAAVPALIVYAFGLDGLQVWSLQSVDRTLGYAAAGMALTLAIRVAGRRRSRPPIPSFDAPSEEMTVLTLSGARG